MDELTEARNRLMELERALAVGWTQEKGEAYWSQLMKVSSMENEVWRRNAKKETKPR